MIYFICGQKFELCAVKKKLNATIFVLLTDNFDYLRQFYFIYLCRNAPEPNLYIYSRHVKLAARGPHAAPLYDYCGPH